MSRVTVTLTSKEGEMALVRANPHDFSGVLTISEKTRQKVNRKFKVDHDDTNPGITSSHTVRVYDEKWDLHTFTFWEKANAQPE